MASFSSSMRESCRRVSVAETAIPARPASSNHISEWNSVKSVTVDRKKLGPNHTAGTIATAAGSGSHIATPMVKKIMPARSSMPSGSCAEMVETPTTSATSEVPLRYSQMRVLIESSAMLDLQARPKDSKLKLAGRDGGDVHRLAAHLRQLDGEVFDAYRHPELDSEGDLFFRIVGKGHVVD